MENLNYLNEEWKPIKGYENLYEISNYGRVRSLDKYVKSKNGSMQFRKGKLIIPHIPNKKAPHYQIQLWKNGAYKYFYIHQLVYIAFVGQIPEGMQVNHLNENGIDNRLENLNLMTPKENSNWGTRNKRIGSKQINGKRSKKINQLTLSGELVNIWASTMEIERKLKFCHSTISKCCKGKLKTAYNYIWKYAD